MRLWDGKRERRNFLVAMVFLMPNLLGFLALTTGPVLLSLYMSFTNWSLKPSVELEWVGLRNYIDLFADGNFWFYLYNTVYFMLGIPLTVAGSLLLANLLVSPMRIERRRLRLCLAAAVAVVGAFTCALLFMGGRRDMALILAVLYGAGSCGILWGSMTYRTTLYVPSFASGVATIILWTEIFNPYHGLANNVLQQLYNLVGCDAALPTWLNSTRSLLGFLPLPEHFSNAGFGIGAREAIMIMGFWMGIGGNNMILYIAAISNIPEDLYEAAEIDGAGAVSKFLHITLPQVAPTTFFITIMATIGGFQGGFNFARIMTQGGPAGTTTTLAYYIYTAGFEELRFGYASSVAWVMFAIIFALTLVNWRYGNRRVTY
jgi:multiple sugar transport system permease protein